MKWFLAVLFLTSCNINGSKTKFYKATKNGTVAVLALNEIENRFYGRYEVRYNSNAKDSGVVSGEIIGDTLKGKYNYTSYGGSKKWEPFVVLKRGDTLKLGSGLATTLLNIPFYLPETLNFSDSNFQFVPIDVKSARNLNLK